MKIKTELSLVFIAIIISIISAIIGLVSLNKLETETSSKINSLDTTIILLQDNAITLNKHVSKLYYNDSLFKEAFQVLTRNN